MEATGGDLEEGQALASGISYQSWWSNQFRLLLSSAAYVLIEAMRQLELQGTELAQAQANTIRLKLLKIATVILPNTRRIRSLRSKKSASLLQFEILPALTAHRRR